MKAIVLLVFYSGKSQACKYRTLLQSIHLIIDDYSK